MASKRMREMIGARLRGEVRKVGAIRSSVDSKTLRRPGMSAPPKLGSMKYSCAISQVAHSRGGAGQPFASAGSCALRHLQSLHLFVVLSSILVFAGAATGFALVGRR